MTMSPPASAEKAASPARVPPSFCPDPLAGSWVSVPAGAAGVASCSGSLVPFPTSSLPETASFFASSACFCGSFLSALESRRLFFFSSARLSARRRRFRGSRERERERSSRCRRRSSRGRLRCRLDRSDSRCRGRRSALRLRLRLRLRLALVRRLEPLPPSRRPPPRVADREREAERRRAPRTSSRALPIV